MNWDKIWEKWFFNIVVWSFIIFIVCFIIRGAYGVYTIVTDPNYKTSEQLELEAIKAGTYRAPKPSKPLLHVFDEWEAIRELKIKNLKLENAKLQRLLKLKRSK